jgi:BON domain
MAQHRSDPRQDPRGEAEYGIPAYSALAGAGFGFTRKMFEPSATQPSAPRSPNARRGPKGYRRSDERIREEICECLTHNGQHIDSSDVSVEVADHHVTLEGTVPQRRMKHAIEDIVASCAGVEDIHNKIRVHHTPPRWFLI